MAGLVLACLVLVAVTGSASARSSGSAPSPAKARLAALEGQIASLQRGLRSLSGRMRDAAAGLDAEEQAFGTTEQQVMAIRARLDAVRARVRSQRDALGRLVRQAYIDGPGAGLDVLLGATSLSDLSERAELVSRVTGVDERTGRALQAERNRLRGQVSRLDRELSRRASLVARRTRDQATLAAAFGEQRRRLADLSGARAELAGLVARQAARLSAREAAAARRAAGLGMSLNYGQWATAFLGSLPAPACRSNLVAMVAWESAEGTQASWNPLATTYSMPGATGFNSSGVKNYGSLDQGLQATAATLRLPGHGYEAVVASLAACSDALATAEAVNASDWCRGCAGGQYVVDLVPIVQAYFDSYAAR